MICYVIELRRDGLRLRQENWPAPLHGSLEMECANAEHNNFRRVIRKAVVYERVGVADRKVGKLFLFDPVLLHTIEDGFVLRGIQLRTMDEGIYEHEQMWICLTRWTGAVPASLGKRLPETGKSK